MIRNVADRWQLALSFMNVILNRLISFIFINNSSLCSSLEFYLSFYQKLVHCDKDSAIIFTTGRLQTSTLKTGVGTTTANATGTNGLTCLPKHVGARDNKFWLPIL
jgi:hypothetical protein